MDLSIEKIIKKLDESDSVLIRPHCKPDGDCVGSSLALFHLLVALGKRVAIYCPDKLPKYLSFISGSENFSREQPTFTPSLVVYLDCCYQESAEKDGSREEYSCPIINIDHHNTNTYYGTVNYVDPSSAATASILYDIMSSLLRNNSLKKFPAAVAESLMVGMLTDTGFLQNSATNPDILFQLSNLSRDSRINPADIMVKLKTMTIETAKVRAEALASMQTALGGRLVWIERDGQSAKWREDGAYNGLADEMRDYEGVEVAALIRTNTEGSYVSMRSRTFDVESIAKKMGGGGHKLAAAASITGNPSDNRKTILQTIIDSLSKKGD